MSVADQWVVNDSWSDLSQFIAPPNIDITRLNAYRLARLREQMALRDVDVCVLFSPVSLRYAINYRNYALFSAHIPCTYLFLAQHGEPLLHAGLDPALAPECKRAGQPISHFYGGDQLAHYAERFADDLLAFMEQTNSQHNRVALEYTNPSITQAVAKRGCEVIDGVLISENARAIKSIDEIECIKWAVKVAEHGADKIKHALQPGVTELQLWGLLNYTNQANDGDWHDGRMLASGERTNPWLQEASKRIVQDGDLVAFDTDMVGPMGYFADLSRTFYCGDSQPTRRQKELYGYAMQELEHNLGLVQAGIDFAEFQAKAWTIPEEFRAQAYPCIMHGVGMCDEFPHLHCASHGAPAASGRLEAGMVVCIESYIGAVGERDGVKLEQQVLVTDTGYELLTHYPFESILMNC